LHFDYRHGTVTGASFEIREGVCQRALGSAAVAVGGEREASGQRGRDRAAPERHETMIGNRVRNLDRLTTLFGPGWHQRAPGIASALARLASFR
jgi:hypothetical protein